jgi:hypothetical protein
VRNGRLTGLATSLLEDCDSLRSLVGKSEIWLVMSHEVLAKVGAALSGSVAGTFTSANDSTLMVRAKQQLRLRTEQLVELVTPGRNVAIYPSKDVGAGVVGSLAGETADIPPWFRRVTSQDQKNHDYQV